MFLKLTIVGGGDICFRFEAPRIPWWIIPMSVEYGIQVFKDGF